jgi:hypothetical protein
MPNNNPRGPESAPEYESVIKPKEVIVYMDSKTELDGQAVLGEKKLTDNGGRPTGSVPYPAMRQELEAQDTTSDSLSQGVRYPASKGSMHTPSNWVLGETPHNDRAADNQSASDWKSNGHPTHSATELDAMTSQYQTSELDISNSHRQASELDSHGAIHRHEMEASYGGYQPGWVELPSEHH